MVWVKSEYAEELAVLSAWLSALIPWSISVAIGEIQGGSLIEFHFPFLLIRVLLGIDVPGPNPLIMPPWEAIGYYSGAPGPLPFAVWTVGAAVVGLAVLLSLAMYVFEDRFRASRRDPVRIMGGLLLVAAVLHTVASGFLQFGALPIAGLAADAFPGILLPVGVVFQFAFAYTLLRVERVDDPEVDTADSDAESDSPDADGTTEE
ncbi:DUF7549 family protein [Halorientalis pallida]|uniref:TIGR04206 family protein n=1 Tax=Halorientalis pallida TaxID=2479928 RepID=A0A498KV74_9EURY|nr:hypothetical protein [Halorientalis pallida]RXK49168.1 hypothetical protein EAF64_09600 [Halorientalis pallida]